MRFFRTSPLVTALMLICIVLLSPAPVQAGPILLTPNGNPTGPGAAYSTPRGDPPVVYYLTLSPSQAITGANWPPDLSTTPLHLNWM